jgi:hypothetical protein
MSAVPQEARSVRAALAVVALCTTSAALYGLLRVAQSLIFSEPDPAMVIWSEHSGFFWRVWIVLYVGGMSAFVTWLASARHAQRIASILTRALPAAAALLAAQAILVP